MIYGYMRVSTQKDKQSTDRQRITLESYAKENHFEFNDILEERISGTVKAENREVFHIRVKIVNKFFQRDFMYLKYGGSTA